MSRSSLLVPFADEDVERVVADHDVSREALEEATVAHQESMRSLPGVEELVYEWRKFYDTSVVRTDEAYYVAVDADIWEEFAAALDRSEVVTDALEALHGATVSGQFRSADEAERNSGFDRIVLVR